MHIKKEMEIKHFLSYEKLHSSVFHRHMPILITLNLIANKNRITIRRH